MTARRRPARPPAKPEAPASREERERILLGCMLNALGSRRSTHAATLVLGFAMHLDRYHSDGAGPLYAQMVTKAVAMRNAQRHNDAIAVGEASAALSGLLSEASVRLAQK